MGQASGEVLGLASISASLQTDLVNPLDEAILQEHRPDSPGLRKRAQAPYDFVRKRLRVVVSDAGRRTFANTLKHSLTTASANLGNMIRMAVISLAPPFLPLLAGQILLNTFLSDVPAVGIAGHTVDPEQVDRPQCWSTRFLGRFMVEFGCLISLVLKASCYRRHETPRVADDHQPATASRPRW